MAELSDIVNTGEPSPGENATTMRLSFHNPGEMTDARRKFAESGRRGGRRAFDFVQDKPRVTRRSTLDLCRELEQSIHLSNGFCKNIYRESSNPLEEDEESEWSMGDAVCDDACSFGKLRNRVGRFVNSKWIQIFVGTIIISNALLLGALTYLYEDPDTASKLEVLETVFLSLFTAELMCQLLYLGKQSIKHGWIVFDTILVVVSWIFLDSNISILRSFRVFRLFALASRWGALRRLVRAVVRTIPNMATITAALFLFFYTFTVLFTNLYHDLYDRGYLDYDYFGRMDKTFLTLFQVMTLDSWTSVVRQVMEVHELAWVGFCIWAVLTSFLFLNLVVAVICESLIELSKGKEVSCQKRTAKAHEEMILNQEMELRDTIIIQRAMLENQVLIQESLRSIMIQLDHINKSNSQSDIGSSEPLSEESLEIWKGRVCEDMSETMEESESNDDPVDEKR